MVAKTYQNLKITSEPYTKNGKKYVKVLTKSGSEKEVRFYTEAEYNKMYPEAKVNNSKTNMKDVLGFTNGYITIFRGNTYEDMDYFKLNAARYNRVFGWHFVSTDELPDDIPEDLEPIRLNWEVVGNEDGSTKPEDEMKNAVEAILYAVQDAGEYNGEIGDTLELNLTVDKIYDVDSYYGSQRMHIFSDDCGRTYVWTTGAKKWEPESKHHVKAKVKAHETYRGRKQTIINYVKEI